MGKKDTSRHGVAIVGFPYVRESFFAVFRHWPEPENIHFLLPRRWPIKDGSTVYTPPTDTRITTARAYFAGYRWKYPIVGGLLKGWMPVFPLFLWKNRSHVGVVYVCSEPILLTTLYYALWAKLLGKRLVLFTWENISYQKKFRGFSRIVHGVLLWANLALSDGLMCGNEDGAVIHRPLMGKKPVAVIPMNGVDEKQFTRNPEMTSRESSLSGKVVFTFIGALGYRKGVHLILQSLPQVIESLPNAHVIIAGSGEYEGEIKRLIDEPFIREHVTLFSWLSHHEVVRLLGSTDVFVYPSIPHKGWAEQFGYSMAEASLMELPVISTRSGSISDVVRDNETGILVPPSDVHVLADAMVRLGRDEQLRKCLGRAGRRYIIERYSNESVARRMYDFFKML